MSIKLRMLFSKTGRAVYISHLDLMHTMQRAFSRAGYQLKYSEGFNPHPQISVAMPLSVGTASYCEIMDFTLVDDTSDTDSIVSDLNSVLPEGIRIERVYQPSRKISEIKWLKVHGIFEYDSLESNLASAELSSFFSTKSMVIQKKTKRGTAPLDIIPLIQAINFTPGDGLVEVETIVSANEPVLNPDSLVEALRQLKPELCPDFAKFVRMQIMDQTNQLFE